MHAVPVLQIFQKHYVAQPIPNTDSHGIFRVGLELPPGRTGILVQIQIDRPAQELHVLEIFVEDAKSGAAVKKCIFNLADLGGADLDEIIFTVELPAAGLVEIVGTTTMSPSTIRLRHMKIIQVDDRELSLASFRDESAELRTDSLKSVFIDTTNRCNANCPHCPTNKQMTEHQERGVMSMPLFEKLVAELESVTIDDTVLFGIFGEPFEDPDLEQRIKLLKARRPDVKIDIATNGALASPERVARIIDDVVRISVHVEAAEPAIYDKLMTPLKAERVFPQIDRLIREFGSKIAVTTPLHGRNVREVPALKARWSRPGAGVAFSNVQTRATVQTAAKEICLAPAAGFWKTDLLDILVVDWDGVVLTTCDDFLKRQPLGDIRTSTVRDIMAGQTRRAVFEALRGYRWSVLPSLTDAVVDDMDFTERFAHVPGPARSCVVRAGQLACGPGTQRIDDAIILGAPPERPLEDSVVFGPYLALGPGRYCATFAGRVREHAETPRVLFEVAAGFGQSRYASAEVGDLEPGPFRTMMEFVHEHEDRTIEFRVFALGGDTQAVVLDEVRVVNLTGPS